MTADPTLVIFDLDGVLVDAQAAENAGLAHVGEMMGVTLDDARRDALFDGRKLQECLDILEELAGVPPPPGAVALARAHTEELIGETMEPIPGVGGALRSLSRRNVPMCVASNSPRDLIECRLLRAGIDAHFGTRLFSAYEVGAWKPDPRLFEWAARSCGASPSDCVVVEDSPVGVHAAVGAGMRVLQYCADVGTSPHDDRAIVFSAMSELPDLIPIHGEHR